MIHSFVSSIRHCNVCNISCFRLIGFGRTKKDGNGGYYSPNILQEVELKYVTNDDCNATWSPLGQSILPSIMCAYDPGKGPCELAQVHVVVIMMVVRCSMQLKMFWLVLSVIIIVVDLIHPYFLESPINGLGSKPLFVPITRTLNRTFVHKERHLRNQQGPP